MNAARASGAAEATGIADVVEALMVDHLLWACPVTWSFAYRRPYMEISYSSEHLFERTLVPSRIGLRPDPWLNRQGLEHAESFLRVRTAWGLASVQLLG